MALGRSGGSFPEQRLVMKPTRRPTVVFLLLACSRPSDTAGARAKNKGSGGAGKKRGETGKEVLFPSLPSFFPTLSLPLFFARAPVSERLEQAILLRVVYSCGPAMSGIIKDIVSFFRKSEEVAIERHRSRVQADKEKHKGVLELKKI